MILPGPKRRIYYWSLITMMIYAQIFANGCNNCCAEKAARATGNINWIKEISADTNETGSTGYLLTAEQKIFVITQKKIVAFDKKGNNLWEIEHWPLSPVALRFNKIFFTSAEKRSRMRAVDFNNNVIIEDFWMPEIVESSFLALFEPVEKGLVAQVQYGPDPDTGKMGFVIYRFHAGGLGMDWVKTFTNQRSKVIPIINIERNVLVTSNESDAYVFDLHGRGNNLKPIAEFSLPLADHTRWLSSGKADDLYWTGENDSVAMLKVTDLKGDTRWEWKSKQAEFPRHAIPILPTIVGPAIQYILTAKKLYAFQSAKNTWEKESGDLDFVNATALSDNSILVVLDKKLVHFNSEGSILFQLNLGEHLVTAPVVDEDGQIYIASMEKIYAIK